MSASEIPLLMTRRRRSEPASGAKVKPVRRTREAAAASSTENVSALRLGSATAAPRSAATSLTRATSSPTCE
jgi:hypothetical protein